MSVSLTRHLVVATVAMVLSGWVHAGEVTVSAASSLTNAFKEVANVYEAQRPGTKVWLNFAASGALLQQIAKGAPVDVFASADQETMDQAEQQGLVLVSGRRNFASNSLVLVMPHDSALSIKQIKDLSQPGVKRVAIGNPASVPVGRYAQAALEAAKIWPAINTKAILTQNVRQSLDYVARGEVEAAFVYATDTMAMKDKVKVAFKVPLAVPIEYPMAVVSGSSQAAEAKDFVGFVLSPAGQAILSKHGFLKP